MKPLTPHWADQAAAQLIRNVGDKSSYTVASGITPSGVVHIGNFREVLTVDLVARALRSLGKSVRFIYSWDDFDTFRKVPANVPNQELLQKHLRRPISRVPDAYNQRASYAAHNEAVFEAELVELGIYPEYLYQHERYGLGLYASQIRKALEATETIKSILNEYRTSPLEDSWLPTAIYCESCERDEMKHQSYLGEWEYRYHCASCDDQRTVDIRVCKNLKLNWRTDWPMRWAYEGVEFEPGGKDHSGEGGSYDTAKHIAKQVFGISPPQYLQYDFVSIKGDTGKMSSSSGTLITLSDAGLVYDPQMIRWIFAGHRPNHDFSLAFDQDVIKTYEEFDRAELEAYAEETQRSSKWPMVRRVYELSLLSEVMPATPPFRAPFRELCNRLQIFDGDIEKTKKRFYGEFLKTPEDENAFSLRCQKAWNWLTKLAPAEFRYQINREPIVIEASDAARVAIHELRELVSNVDLNHMDAKDLNQLLYDKVIHPTSVDSKEFFYVVYQKLISRDKGPRLPAFMIEIGKDRLLSLLQ